MIVMSLVFMGYLVAAYVSNNDTGEPLRKSEEAGGRCAKNDFEVKNIQWGKGGSEGPGVLESVTITNKGTEGCKDIRGSIIFFSENKAELGRSGFVIHEKLPSRATGTFRNIITGQPPSSPFYSVTAEISGAVPDTGGPE